MYTVILYRNGNVEGQDGRKLNIDKFRFLFAGMEQDDRLALYKLDAGSNLKVEHIVQKIDMMVGTHRGWRLMIFDGEAKLEISQGGVKKVNEELQCIIEYYGQSDAQKDTLVCRCFPDEIWYIGWMEKRDIAQLDDLVSNQLGKSSVVNPRPLRAFSIIADVESQMGKRFSEFMACYGLLTLAINQFPAGFLSSAFLYFIESEIDWKLFGEYVNLQQENILKIEGLLEAEIMKQQKQRKDGVPCPEYFLENVEMPAQSEPPDIKKLKQRIKWRDSKADIEYALNRNSVEIRGWMYYPRGVMSGKVDKLSEALDSENMSRAFLNIQGKDRLEREKRAALEELSIQNRVAMDQRSFEYELRRRGECIKKRARRRITSWQKILPYAFLAAVEAGFVVSLCHLIQPDAMDRNMMLGIGAVSALLVVAGLEIAGILFWQYTKGQYIHFLKKEMNDKTGRMHKYLQDTLKRVAKYQYYIRLNREQQELQQIWEQQNKRLEHHKFICRQSKETAKQMQYFLDEDERIAFDIPRTMPVIDFMEEPQEVSEYWFSQKSRRSKAELNTSGYMMETMSGFITRFKCVKDVRQLTLDSQ